jgi:DNA-binding transcriptional ArsR family regulator
VEDWPLLQGQQAAALEAIFKVLANATRLRLLHAIIRTPGISVGDLSTALGMKIQAVSNQLRRLVDQGIVEPVRDGNKIRYHIVNVCTLELFNQGMCLSKATVLAAEEDISPKVKG